MLSRVPSKLELKLRSAGMDTREAWPMLAGIRLSWTYPHLAPLQATQQVTLLHCGHPRVCNVSELMHALHGVVPRACSSTVSVCLLWLDGGRVKELIGIRTDLSLVMIAGVMWKGFETYSQISLRNIFLVASDWVRTKLFGRDISKV